jgi:hypothetical protein
MKLKGLRLLSYTTALLPFALDGQIVLDGTMGHAGALPGPNYQITAALGMPEQQDSAEVLRIAGTVDGG